MKQLIEGELTGQIIGAAVEVHRELGAGLLESAYQICMMHELMLRHLNCDSELHVPVRYKGILLDAGYRLDFLVEGRAAVELKAVEKVLPVHEAQLLTYMKLLNVRVGLLINFHVPVLTEGLTRLVL